MPARKLKGFLWQLAHANLVLALSTAGAVFVVGYLLGLPSNPIPVIIAFLVTFAVYNFNRYTDKGEDSINHPKRVEFIRIYGRALVVLSVIAYFVAISLSFLGGPGAQIIVVIPLIAVMLYGLPWFPKNGDATRRLKEFFIIKNLLVSSVWAGAVTFLPILYFETGFSTASVLIFIFFFIRFFINTAVFDMRDIPGDKKEHINSIPVVLGYSRARNVLQAINLLGALYLIGVIELGLLPNIALPLIFNTFYTFIYLTYLRLRKDVHFTCDVIVDGEYFILVLFYGLIIAI